MRRPATLSVGARHPVQFGVKAQLRAAPDSSTSSAVTLHGIADSGWAGSDVHDRHTKGVTARAQGKTRETARVANWSLTQALSPKRSQAQTMPTQADHSASFQTDETKR